MKANKPVIPSGSLTAVYLPADYTDVFTTETVPDHKATPDDMVVSFWTDFPGWVNMLFRIRDFAVRFVGLKGGEQESHSFENAIRHGSENEIMKVVAKNSNETVLELRDSHLDAYLSVHFREGEAYRTVSVITLVKFHNRLGRLYFVVIKPFHKLIVARLLVRAVRNTAR